MNCLIETIWLTFKHWFNGGNEIMEGHVYEQEERIDAWVIVSKCNKCNKQDWNWVRKDDPISLDI